MFIRGSYSTPNPVTVYETVSQLHPAETTYTAVQIWDNYKSNYTRSPEANNISLTSHKICSFDYFTPLCSACEGFVLLPIPTNKLDCNKSPRDTYGHFLAW